MTSASANANPEAVLSTNIAAAKLESNDLDITLDYIIDIT
jgi:hypothetical protein